MTPEQIEERLQQIDDLLNEHKHRLHERKMQHARAGSGADPVITTEIEDVEERIHTLETEREDLLRRRSQPGHSLPEPSPSSDLLHNVFTDREEDIKQLRQTSTPYVVLDAPAGYGKTRLLHKLLAWYRERGWHCAYVDLRDHEMPVDHNAIIDCVVKQIRHHAQSSTRQGNDRLGRLVAAIYQGNAAGSLIVFDSADVLDEQSARWLSSAFTALVFQGLKAVEYHGTYRVIFAGRYIASSWLSYGLPIHSWRRQHLGPFDLGAITEAVYQASTAVQAGLNDSTVHRISRLMLACTGGHPYCIARVLNDLAAESFGNLVEYLEPEGQEHIYQQHVREALYQVKRGVDEHLWPVIETLSIFRRFERHTIQFLMEQGDILTPPSRLSLTERAFELRQAIVATHLVGKKDFFMSDDIVRRLLVLQMRHDQCHRFAELCERAERYYQLVEQQGLLPAKLATLERTFARLQRFIVEPEDPGVVGSSIEAMIRQHIACVDDPIERRERLDYLEQTLREDWEWQVLCVDLMSAEGFEQMMNNLKSSL